MSDAPHITRSRLIRDLRDLGVTAGQVVMLHVSVKSIGWVVGGPEVVLQAILDVLGPSGSLMMPAGWEDNPYHIADWPEDRQQAYLDECPPFDPARSRADHRSMSILAEYLRTWPGACRSGHPESSFAAVGRLAAWLTENHSLQYGHGPGSPMSRLCRSGGQVLLLGVGFNRVTLLHHAEHLANVPNKRTVRYKMPVLQDGQRVWVDVEEYDTSRGIVDWPVDYFDAIVQDYVAAGRAYSGRVGAAQSHLFDAVSLNQFAVEWMERHFAGNAV